MANIRLAIQNHEVAIWEGEVERFGGPFNPTFTASGPLTITPLDMWVDDPDQLLCNPSTTLLEAFGSGDPFYSFPHGGDSGHPTHKFLKLIDEATSTQNLATMADFANTFAEVAPASGFVYAIPPNQAFTGLNPAGTLAAGTITLPAVFPQGGRLEIFTTQTVAALTVAAPNGHTIVGTPAYTIAANATIAYRCIGMNWCRVQ